jgi:hypothetical protein
MPFFKPHLALAVGLASALAASTPARPARADDTAESPSAEAHRVGAVYTPVGASLLLTGGLAIAGGFALVTLNPPAMGISCGPSPSACTPPSYGGDHATGALLLVGGIGAGIAGGILTELGLTKLTSTPDDAPASARPEVRLGISSASLGWRF